MRKLPALCLLALGILLAPVGALAQEPPGTTMSGPVFELRATGVVDPFLSSYLVGGIEKAADDGAGAILIIIDTPGGLASATREITQAILDSPVPVITYVSPPGARAASAGTFILMSGSVAAMAPGTNVGAAHPVGVSGVIAEEKATNDAAASLMSIAEARGRSTEFAEAAVRDSLSITADQAVEDDVIDLVATDVPALLDEVDGMSVTVANGDSVVLQTAQAAIIEEGMNPVLGFLHGLLSPDLAFLFFWLGLALLILEIFIPGGVLGVLGGVMFLLAIVSFGMLPVQLLGIAFLVASVILFIVEIQSPGIGVPMVAGTICLIAGGLTLFDPAVPSAQVSPWMLVLVTGVALLFFGWVIQAAISMRRRPVASEADLVGQDAVVIRTLDPSGTVRVHAEEWTAVAPETIAEGATVTITEVDGLRLKVEVPTERE